MKMLDAFKKGRAVGNAKVAKEASIVASLVALLVPLINIIFGIEISAQDALAVVTGVNVVTHLITSTKVGFGGG